MDGEDGKLQNNIKLVSIEKSRDELFTSGKALQVWMLFKHDVKKKVFDSHCVEMGVEAVEMDWEDGKLQNNIKLVSIEKSRDELFTSGKGNTNVYVI